MIAKGKGNLKRSKVILHANECCRKGLSGIRAVAQWIQSLSEKRTVLSGIILKGT